MKATRAGENNYEGSAASASFPVTLHKATQGCAVVGDQVSVSDATLTCALTATRAGENNYEGSAASASFPVTLHKATQGSVTVTAPGNVTYGTPGTATATGGNAGAFSFNVGASTGCAVVRSEERRVGEKRTCERTATRGRDNNNEGSAASASCQVTLHKET